MIIDVHHHWTPKNYFDNLEKLMRKGEYVTRDPRGGAHIWKKGLHLMPYSSLFWDLERQIEDMDEAGVDMAILSEAYWQERITLKTAPYLNDSVANIVAKYPKRFAGMGQTPLEGKAALMELERVSRELKLSAISINTHIGYRGLPPDDERFWPFWEKVAELDMPVAVQPYSYNAESEPLWGFDIIFVYARRDNVLRFVLRMVYGPLLDKFPTLKILCPKLGAGYIFSVRPKMAADINYVAGRLPLEELDERRRETQERIRQHLKQLYFENAPACDWGQPELTCALEVYGEDRILFGTDYPVGPTSWMKSSVETMLTMKTTSQVKRKVLGENAATFLNIPLRSDSLLKIA